MTGKRVFVSVGAGFENDRRDLGGMAAQALAGFEGPRYLIFECLAERTLALKAIANDAAGLVEHALSFVAPVLDICAAHNIKIISNFGGPDPAAVAAGLHDHIAARGVDLKVAAVTGDALPLGDDDPKDAIAKNAYIGASGIVQALAQGADVVVAGRVADPSLVVGPAVHELELDWTQWDALATATLAGHLIECGTQVCGGYIADEGLDMVPDLAHVGPPVAEITADAITLRKPLGGGTLNPMTVTLQMLYEMHDTTAYLTPDVVLDLSGVALTELAPNTVQISGAIGHPRPETLKTLLCRNTGWFAEAEISYMGRTASVRGEMARDVLRQRLTQANMQIDLTHGTTEGTQTCRLRLALRTADKACAQRALNEVDALYVNGPAGGGGVRKSLHPLVLTEPGCVAQSDVRPQIEVIA